MTVHMLHKSNNNSKHYFVHIKLLYFDFSDNYAQEKDKNIEHQIWESFSHQIWRLIAA